MKITVLGSLWGADGQEFVGGDHEIAKPTRAFLKLAAAAEAAGAIEVHASKDERATMSKHVESDSESVKALDRAMASGKWQEANAVQHELDVAQGAPTGSVGGDR